MSEEMTPQKWLIAGAAVVAVVVAMGIIYYSTRGPSLPVITTKVDKDEIIQRATGSGTQGPSNAQRGGRSGPAPQSDRDAIQVLSRKGKEGGAP